MSEWPEVELGDHADQFVGFPFKSAGFVDSPSEAIRLVRGDNVGQGTLRWSGAKHWPLAKSEDLTRYQLAVDDVILAMDRPWIEAGLKYAYVKPSDLPCLLVQRVTRLRGSSTLDIKFLRYVIASEAFVGHVKAITTGVNVPHISGKDIARFKFRLPPIETQRRIAGILGAYDDLIEVNRRRVAVLEDMARGLFEGLIAIPAGGLIPAGASAEDRDLPNGWRIASLGEYSEVLMGQSPQSVDLNKEGIGLPFHQGVSDFGHLFPSQRVFSTSINSKRMAVSGDLLFSVRAPVGRINIATEALMLGRGVAAIRAQGIAQSFLTTQLRAIFHAVDLIGNGAIYKAVNRKDIERVKIIIPPENLIDLIDHQVQPILDMLLSLERANARLVASRDLLLPRLMSGQLSVAEAQKELEIA